MKKNSIGIESTILDAVRSIESSYCRMVAVVDSDNYVVGTVTDGDIRRCLLRGGSLQTPVTDGMNLSPLIALENSADEYLLDLLRKRNVLAMPLVDFIGCFSRVVHLSELVGSKVNTNQDTFAFAVIMAGGEGRRLQPLTATLPKPMVEIGGVPILERQIRRLRLAGVRRIYLAINYLGNIIEQHFGDGIEFGVEILYLREEKSLGTAGALALLPENPNRSILVMNGDIFTFSDFTSMYSFHNEQSADITIAAINYRVHIPYGVIKTEFGYVKQLQEKPSEQFLCNAGIYVLSPNVLKTITKIKFRNMTDIVEKHLQLGRSVGVFPMHEYWSDIGTPSDLDKARIFFAQHIDNKSDVL